MTTITIREAVAEDLPVVDALAQEAVGVPQPQGKYLKAPEDDALAHLRPDHGRIVLVAETDEQVVGMVSAGLPPKDRPARDEQDRPIDFSKAPWWKVYALATTAPRSGVATALMRELQQRLPRRMRGLYGNVQADNETAVAFYRSLGFYIAPSLGAEGPGGRPTLMVECAGELYFIAPRQRLFRSPEQWESNHADRLMLEQIKLFSRLKQRSDVGYRTWLRSLPATPAACGHDRLGPRPLITFGYDPAHRMWCSSCRERAIHVISGHPDMDESTVQCDNCGDDDPGTEQGWAHDEQRRLIGMAYLCPVCRTA